MASRVVGRTRIAAAASADVKPRIPSCVPAQIFILLLLHLEKTLLLKHVFLTSIIASKTAIAAPKSATAPVLEVCCAGHLH